MFTQLPGEAVFSRLALPALAAVAPMILYHALPLLVAGAVVWCYANFLSEGTLAVLYSAGLSPWSVRGMVLGAVLGMTGLGYALSCVAAPWTAGNMHDVLFSLRHDLNPVLLRPGQFNNIDAGRLVIFFDRPLADRAFADVFIRERLPDRTERTYSAQRAALADGAGTDNLVLFDGSVQFFDARKGEMQVVAFEAMSVPVGTFGKAGLTRTYRLADELGPIGFWHARGDSADDPESARAWVREAVKRFGLPPLTILHTFFALELMAAWRMMDRRQRYPVVPVLAVVAVFHLATVVAAEQIGFDLDAGWVVAGLVGGELTVVLGLMAIRQVRAGPARLFRLVGRRPRGAVRMPVRAIQEHS